MSHFVSLPICYELGIHTQLQNPGQVSSQCEMCLDEGEGCKRNRCGSYVRSLYVLKILLLYIVYRYRPTTVLINLWTTFM